jgi:uncharacterized protein
MMGAALAEPKQQERVLTLVAVGSKNVEIVRGLYRKFRDEDVRALMELFDPNIEYRVVEIGTETYRGQRAMREATRRWLEEWQDYEVQPQEFIERGNKVLVVTSHVAVPRTGPAVRQSFFHVVTLRDGKIVRFEEFTERRAAYEAAGILAEQG